MKFVYGNEWNTEKEKMRASTSILENNHKTFCPSLSHKVLLGSPISTGHKFTRIHIWRDLLPRIIDFPDLKFTVTVPSRQVVYIPSTIADEYSLKSMHVRNVHHCHSTPRWSVQRLTLVPGICFIREDIAPIRWKLSFVNDADVSL